MQFNLAIEKCAVLHIGQSNPKYQYTIGGITLESKTEIRDLGIIMDSKLNFSKHCEHIVKDAGKRQACIYRQFESRSANFLKKMFLTFVRPKLEYASEVFSPHLLKDIDLIEAVQRKFTRNIPSIRNKGLSYSNRLSILDLDSLELRRIKADMCMVYKITHGLVDIRLEEIFELNTHYKTRNNGLKLKLPYANIDARKYSFAVRTVNIWNSLPRNIVLSPTLDKFKDELNTDFCHHLLNKHINGRAFKCR
jgi:hypothetical protein